VKGERSLESMHGIVCAAVEAVDLEELAVLALPRLVRAFDTSLAGCYEIVDGRMSGYMVPDLEPFARYLDYAHDDPLQSVKLRYNPRVAVTTAMAGPAALGRSAVYADIYRRFDAEQHLVLRISEQGYGESGVTAIVLARSQKQPAWSSEDEEDLHRLRPALAAFFRRYARSRGPRGAPRPGVGAHLVFDRAGKVLWASPEATGLAGRSGTCRLPEPVLAAVRRLGAIAETPSVPRALDVELDATTDGRRLRASLTLARSPATGERLVLATVSPAEEKSPLASAVDAAAARHGLSPAEAAVLREMTSGATNAQIARKLSISPNTVRTHLMHVFPKLGVHSRTAALAKVGEGLSSSSAARR
jgi:DNA-binding CsgD family transcriptional regulator